MEDRLYQTIQYCLNVLCLEHEYNQPKISIQAPKQLQEHRPVVNDLERLSRIRRLAGPTDTTELSRTFGDKYLLERFLTELKTIQSRTTYELEMDCGSIVKSFGELVTEIIYEFTDRGQLRVRLIVRPR